MTRKAFSRKKTDNPKEFLESAVEAERYVHSFLRKTPDGICFAEKAGTERDSLYQGTAGVLHMYVQMNRVVSDQKYLYIIQEMTRYLSMHYLDGVKEAKKNGEFVPGMAEAFYTGIGGIGLVFNEVYREFQDDNAKKAAKEIAAYYKEHAVKNAHGIYWSDNFPIFFDGGIVLFLIDTYETYKDNSLIALIEAAADYIIHCGTAHKDGGLELDHLQVDFKHKEPNFEFGTAGAGYLFTKVFALTGKDKYLEAAKQTAVYLKSIAVLQSKGYLIPYKLGVYDDLFYLGNCHGPVGTAKLFYALYKATGEHAYYEQVIGLCDGMEALGAPFYQSAGYWNTTCLCCGPAGFIPLYAGLFYEDGDERWKKLAHGVGEILLGTKQQEKLIVPPSVKNAPEYRSKWQLAFDRTKPEALSTPAGYYTGAAGIAAALLSLYCLEVPGKTVLSLIDDPYARQKVI